MGRGGEQVVGSSWILEGSLSGDEIDKHEQVLLLWRRWRRRWS